MTQIPQKDDPQPLSKTRLRLWLRLLKLSRQIEGELRDNLRRDFTSTLPRFDVLAALDRFPDGLKMSELSGVLMVSNGNVTGIVDRLVSDCMIVRAPVPGDRRASRVKLTAKGRAEFARQARSHETWINRIFTTLDRQEARDVCALLDKVETTMTEKADPP